MEYKYDGLSASKRRQITQHAEQHAEANKSDRK